MKKFLFAIAIVSLIALNQNVFAANDLVEMGLNPYDKSFVMDVNSATNVDVNADLLRVQGLCFKDVDLTISISSSGADGLEASDSEANSAWYEVYVVAKEDGTLSGLLNESGTAIGTMPTDYIFKRLVGYVRNDSSYDLVQYEKKILGGYVERGDVSGFDFTIADFTTDLSWRSLSLNTIIPPNAIAVKMRVDLQDNILSSSIAFDKTGIGSADFVVYSVEVNCYNSVQGEIPCDSSQNIKYRGTTTFTNINLVVIGWIESNL